MTAVHVVMLPVGADLYAVPITWMREVLAHPEVTALVTGPSMVIGLINLRGEVVPLLDTALLLGVGQVTETPFAAVLHTAYGPVGLAATALPERVPLDTLTGPSELPGTTGRYRVNGRVVVLLDPVVLLTPEHVGGLPGIGRSTLAGAL